MKISFRTHGVFIVPVVNEGQKDERQLSPAENLALVNFLNTSIVFGDTILEAQQVQDAAREGAGQQKKKTLPDAVTGAAPE